jgi:hypothetical protein
VAKSEWKNGITMSKTVAGYTGTMIVLCDYAMQFVESDVQNVAPENTVIVSGDPGLISFDDAKQSYVLQGPDASDAPDYIDVQTYGFLSPTEITFPNFRVVPLSDTTRFPGTWNGQVYATSDNESWPSTTTTNQTRIVVDVVVEAPFKLTLSNELNQQYVLSANDEPARFYIIPKFLYPEIQRDTVLFWKEDSQAWLALTAHTGDTNIFEAMTSYNDNNQSNTFSYWVTVDIDNTGLIARGDQTLYRQA